MSGSSCDLARHRGQTEVTKPWAKGIFILCASSCCYKGCQIPLWKKTMNLEEKCNIVIFYPKEPASFSNVWMFSSMSPGPWAFQEVCSELRYSPRLQGSSPSNSFHRVPGVCRYKSRARESSSWKERSVRKLVEAGRGRDSQQQKGLLRPICKRDASLSRNSAFLALEWPAVESMERLLPGY